MSHSKHKKNNNFKKNIFYFILITIFIIVLSSIILFFKNSYITYSKDYVYKNNKKYLHIDDLNIDISQNVSIIKATLNNTANHKTNNETAHIYIYNNNNTLIFSTKFSIPEIESNSSEVISIASSDIIDNIYDYKIIIK